MDYQIWLFIFFGILLVAALIEKFYVPPEEGTLQERRNNPVLNTNNIELHNERLDEFEQSKLQGVMYYIGPKGGCYFYNSKGRKQYV